MLAAPFSASAQAWLQDHRPMPDHPTIITALYHGKTYPVTAASGEHAQIDVDGKLHRMGLAESFQTPRAVGYAPGYVEFTAQDASSVTHTRSYGSMARMNSDGAAYAVTGDYRTTVVAKESQADCFLAVIFFREDDLGRPIPNSTAIAFREIGQLVGGRATDLRIDTSYLVKPGVTFYSIPLIFTKGVEIRSSQSEVASQFFRSEEMTAHAELLTNYKKQYATANRPAAPYLRFPPQLPANVDATSLPPVIKTTFAVTEEGEVDNLEIDISLLDPAVRRAIRRTIDGWLFFPCLKNGIPTQVTMTLPLAFSSPAK